MQKQFVFYLLGIATLLSSVQAINTIKGNLYVNDQLRLKELIVDPNQSQFIPQKYFQNQFAQMSSQQDQQIEQTDHEKQVDQAETGIITNNAWCEQCQLTNVKVSEKLIGETLNVNVIKGQKNANDPDQDGIITILGDLSIQDKEDETETSNLNINLIQSKSVTVNGVRQWSLLDSESFSFTKQQSNSTLLQNGWKVIKADTSYEPLKTEEEMATASLNEKIYKKFEDLPEHTYIKIEGNFYFLSPFWKGESAQIRIDNKIVWLDSHKWTENLTSGIEDMCQMNISDFNQYVWIQPVSFVVKHKQESFEIELGLTKLIDEILKCSSNSNKLESIPLFGFDDFSLYIK